MASEDFPSVATYGSPLKGVDTNKTALEVLFDKLVLHPENVARSRPRKPFGNPTPIALTGFLISLSQLSCDLMGWRGAGGGGAAGAASYVFFGGVLQLLGGLLEWFLGHTFPSVVFCSFGAFFFSFGTTFMPSFAAWSSYAAEGEAATSGLATQGYNASAGFNSLWMALLCAIYMVGALRTNICFVLIFIFLTLGCIFVAAADWLLAADYIGNAAAASRMTVAAGATFFGASMMAWWVFTSVMLVAVDFPIQIPVGDLSNVIRGRSERTRAVVQPEESD